MLPKEIDYLTKQTQRDARVTPPEPSIDFCTSLIVPIVKCYIIYLGKFFLSILISALYS